MAQYTLPSMYLFQTEGVVVDAVLDAEACGRSSVAYLPHSPPVDVFTVRLLQVELSL